MTNAAGLRFQAAIFDLDGTLLNTLEDLTDSVNEVLSDGGFPLRSLDEIRGFVGDGIAMLIRRSLPESAAGDENVAGRVAAFRKVYAKNWRAKTRPYPGVAAMLSDLAALGLPLAVLSNKSDANTKQAVAHFFPQVPFAAVLGEREGVPRKPDPAGALEIARVLEIPPSQFLYLGDSLVDAACARAAGMSFVAALWGFRSRAELAAASPLALAENPAGVTALARGE